MKQFLNNISKFIVYSLILYIVLLVSVTLFAPFDFITRNIHYPIASKGFTKSRLQDVDTTKNIDILFLGSSHCYRSFDPRIYKTENLRAFNLGSPSQTPIQTKYLLDLYLDQLNPKLIVFEVYPATFQNDGVESSLDIIANSEMLPNMINMVWRINHIMTYNSFIYDQFREFFNLNKSIYEPLQKGSDQYITGGFVTTNIMKNMSPITEKTKRVWASSKWKIKPSQWKAFEDIIYKINDRGIDYILLQTPVTKDAYDLYLNNEEIDSLFNKVGVYYNLNLVLNLNDTTDFMDYHHLNPNGVEKTNKEIIQLLRSKDNFKFN